MCSSAFASYVAFTVDSRSVRGVYLKGEPMQMEGERVGEKETTGRGFAACRRAGSSWNRGTSAWSVPGAVGARDPQRQRRKPGMDVPGMNVTAECLAHNNDTSTASRNRESENIDSEMATADDPTVQLHIQKEAGVFQVKGSVDTVVDPDTLYGIITDYNSNSRVFRNVDRVEVEDKGDEKVVTQYLHWNFLLWSGNYDIKMRMRDDPQNRSISYELEQPGFLKVFNGSWTVEPLSSEGTSDASKLVVDQKALPAFFPPGPLAVGAGTYAQRIMSGQMRNLLSDLALEASEVKKNSMAASSV